MFSRAHLVQVLDRRVRLEEMGVTVAVVVHDPPDVVHAKMLRDLELPWPLLVDLDCDLYRAWGCRRASLMRSFLSPAVNFALLRLLIRGERMRGFGRDVFQLGGDFVVAPGGTLTFAHVMTGTIDRPAADILISEVGKAAEASLSGLDR